MLKHVVRAALVGVLVAAGAAAPVAAEPASQRDIYPSETSHPEGVTINGRQWRTSCSQYSSMVDRCRTEIVATQVKQVTGRFVATTGWVFNNLTYTASLPEASWKGNPPAQSGSWTAEDGRKWRTECHTATTGRGGCRSYVEADVIESFAGGYRWVRKEIFNNQVRFLPEGSFSPLAVKDVNLRECLLASVVESYPFPSKTWPISAAQLSKATSFSCPSEVRTWEGMPSLPNVTHLNLIGSTMHSFKGMPVLPKLETMTLQRATIATFAGMPAHPRLSQLDLQFADVAGLETLPVLPNLRLIDASAANLTSLAMPTQPSLVQLRAGATHVTSLKAMPPLPKLEELGLSGTFTTFQGMPSYPALKELFVVRETAPGAVAGDCRVSTLVGLPELPSLERMGLLGCQLTSLGGLRPMPALWDLRVPDNRITSYQGAEYLLDVAPKLKFLEVSGNPATDRAPLQPLIDAGVVVR